MAKSNLTSIQIKFYSDESRSGYVSVPNELKKKHSLFRVVGFWNSKRGIVRHHTLHVCCGLETWSFPVHN